MRIIKSINSNRYPLSIRWITRLLVFRLIVYLVLYSIILYFVSQGRSETWKDLIPFLLFKKASYVKAIGESGFQYSIGFIGIAYIFRVLYSVGLIFLIKYKKKVWFWIVLGLGILQTVGRFNPPLLLIAILGLGLIESSKHYFNKKNKHKEERVIDILIQK